MKKFRAAVIDNAENERRILDAIHYALNTHTTRHQIATCLVAIDADMAVAIIAKIFRGTITPFIQEWINKARSLDERDEQGSIIDSIDTYVIEAHIKALDGYLNGGVEQTPEYLFILDDLHEIATVQQREAINASQMLFYAINYPHVENIERLVGAMLDTIFAQ